MKNISHAFYQNINFMNQNNNLLQSKTSVIFTTILLIFLFSIKSFGQVPAYVDTAGLIGWYSFTGNANDSSGNGYNGTVYGATLTTDRFGNANSAYSFDGISNYINLNIGFSSGSSNKSFSIWFNLTDSIYHWMISGGTSSDGNAFGLYYDKNLTTRLIFHGNGLTYDYAFANISLNQWNHVAITFDGVSVYAYLNGQYIGSKIVALNTAASHIKVGCRENNSAYFQGKIDDIGVWNRVLTQCEIIKLYQSRNNPIINQPIDDSVLTGGIATYTITDTGGTATYHWQENSGSGFVNLSPIAPYSGVATKTLTINPVTTTMNNYKYRCIRNGDCSDTSNAANLVVKTSNGITNISTEQITIAPNPATNTITITSIIPIEKIEITNMIGQTIISQQPNRNSIKINVQNLASGLYIIKLNGNYIKRFVKE